MRMPLRPRSTRSSHQHAIHPDKSRSRVTHSVSQPVNFTHHWASMIAYYLSVNFVRDSWGSDGILHTTKSSVNLPCESHIYWSLSHRNFQRNSCQTWHSYYDLMCSHSGKDDTQTCKSLKIWKYIVLLGFADNRDAISSLTLSFLDLGHVIEYKLDVNNRKDRSNGQTLTFCHGSAEFFRELVAWLCVW